MQDIAVNEEEEVVLLMGGHPGDIEKGFYILPVEATGGAVQGVEISVRPTHIVRSEYHHDRVIFMVYGAPYHGNNFLIEGKSIIFNIDLASNAKWSKYLNGRIRQNKFSMDNKGSIFIANTPHDNFHDDLYNEHTSVLELFKLDEAGNTVWKKGLLLKDSLFFEFEFVSIRDMALDGDSNIYLLGDCGIAFGPNKQTYPYIIKFDSAGVPLLLKTLTVKGQLFNEIEITSNGLMLLNHAPNNPYYYASNKESAKLLKFDFDLNLLWGKQYSGENFPYYSTGIKEKPNGNLLMSHSTFGAYPVVLTEMDEEGNILAQKGYPNYYPQVAVVDDGSLLMSSKLNYNDAGETFYQPVIAKTNPNGEIDGCENYTTCITAEEYTVEFGTFHYDTVSIPDLEDFDTLVKPVTFSFSSGCNFPPPPTPDFNFPDTLCLADSASTSATNNRLANAHEWNLTGPGTDSVNTDSFDFSFRFLNAGEYNLKHTVWVLGCSYEFDKKITVLPELEVEIAPLHLCPDEPQEITAISDYPNLDYLWSTGDETATLLVNHSGLYSVQVNIGGACMVTDTADVFLAADLLGFENPIQLPADTILCDDDLPYLLKIKSGYSDVFFINNDTMFNGEYILNKGGGYLISTEIEGCRFSKTFNLKTSDCIAKIYFPNIFSPNNDGINDEFFPQGKDFETISLKVFDRWGGLRYNGAGSGAKWSPRSSMAEGTYAYLLVYKNTLTGEVGQESGSVVLIR